jgi:hypothetical protein
MEDMVIESEVIVEAVVAKIYPRTQPTATDSGPRDVLFSVVRVISGDQALREVVVSFQRASTNPSASEIGPAFHTIEAGGRYLLFLRSVFSGREFPDRGSVSRYALLSNIEFKIVNDKVATRPTNQPGFEMYDGTPRSALVSEIEDLVQTTRGRESQAEVYRRYLAAQAAQKPH